MSKDSSAGGTSSIGFQELLRTNPEILERIMQGGMFAASQQGQQEQQGPVMVRDMTTPQAVESFYGSSDRIVQPDQSYYQEFALPGVQMDRPETAEEAEIREAARRNGDGSGGLLGFGGQPTEEDLRAAASMPILDVADGQYQPDMRAYMNFLGGMR